MKLWSLLHFRVCHPLYSIWKIFVFALFERPIIQLLQLHWWGGGAYPRPGEISLAHHGVLFLDELPEFDRRVLEVLRQPLENGQMAISRAQCKTTFPARFQLIAAMNPCPCGFYGHPQKACRCTPTQIAQYLKKISGPLLDRIDVALEVPSLTSAELRRAEVGESSTVVRHRVEAAYSRMMARQGTQNALLTSNQLDQCCGLDEAGKDLLTQAIDKLALSARAYYRILKVSRTIADLAGETQVCPVHLREAIQYRTFAFVTYLRNITLMKTFFLLLSVWCLSMQPSMALDSNTPKYLELNWDQSNEKSANADKAESYMLSESTQENLVASAKALSRREPF